MTNNNLYNTINRLYSGDKIYLRALGHLTEYKMTNGRKRNEVAYYLNQKLTKRYYFAYISLLFFTTFSSAFLCIVLRTNSPLPLAFTFWGLYQILKLKKYLERSQIYLDVEEYFNMIDPNERARRYNKWLKQVKEQENARREK